jgi:NAD(P)-dependent dehydrogenase (short-subunit alcohol dehydrogenase family)
MITTAKTILVTGANRGIGQALVEEALGRGAKRVYADIPKASPESVARAIFDAVEKEEEDIFPDPMSQFVAESWRNSPAKTLERQQAALAQAPVTA